MIPIKRYILFFLSSLIFFIFIVLLINKSNNNQSEIFHVYSKDKGYKIIEIKDKNTIAIFKEGIENVDYSKLDLNIEEDPTYRISLDKNNERTLNLSIWCYPDKNIILNDETRLYEYVSNNFINIIEKEFTHNYK